MKEDLPELKPMISCPKCNSSLPDWAQKCQFCGTDTTKVARPVVQKTKQRIAAFETPLWVNIAYYSIAGWFILSALISGATSIIAINSASNRNSILGEPNAFDYIGLVFCGIQVIIGLGLIFKIEIIRAIVNFFCAIQILLSILGGLAAFPMMIASPLIGILYLLLQIFNIATAGFMIYLIGETDAGSNI